MIYYWWLFLITWLIVAPISICNVLSWNPLERLRTFVVLETDVENLLAFGHDRWNLGLLIPVNQVLKLVFLKPFTWCRRVSKQIRNIRTPWWMQESKLILVSSNKHSASKNEKQYCSTIFFVLLVGNGEKVSSSFCTSCLSWQEVGPSVVSLITGCLIFYLALKSMNSNK